MTPAAIIREAAADGVSLALSPAGTIKATGDQAAVIRLPVLREHKPEILARSRAPPTLSRSIWTTCRISPSMPKSAASPTMPRLI
jgi:hypothetical protein